MIERSYAPRITQGDGGSADTSAPIAVTYRTAAGSGVPSDGWYLHDGTPATFTGRTRPVWWHGTASQIPTQGNGDAELQTGDIAITRTTSL